MTAAEHQRQPRRGIRVTYVGHPPGSTSQAMPGVTANFWRAGIQFTLGQPRLLALADLTPQQQLLLRDEGMPQGRLTVEDVEDIDAIAEQQR